MEGKNVLPHVKQAVAAYEDTTLNLTTICHAGQQQQPGLAQGLPETDSAKLSYANIRSGGLLPRKYSPDGATEHTFD